MLAKHEHGMPLHPNIEMGIIMPCPNLRILVLQYLAVTSLLGLIRTYEHYKAKYGLQDGF